MSNTLERPSPTIVNELQDPDSVEIPVAKVQTGASGTGFHIPEAVTSPLDHDDSEESPAGEIAMAKIENRNLYDQVELDDGEVETASREAQAFIRHKADRAAAKVALAGTRLDSKAPDAPKTATFDRPIVPGEPLVTKRVRKVQE